ncbi:phage tail terminator-like protein [Nitrospirillum amazonense]|uniref:phage tail terminator-like protein n=1 Tax=Nitrospirillum amazonense TaxID=28077 RepID=UPI002DD42586|nr:phage tail terminator-like protein [Nitrospirillum amazonense]MEC4590568.1 phage tail terminator-like protein [Nitrospirillum amazonense]
MSRIAIRAALEAQLATLTPAWPTAWENVPFTPTEGVAWQRAKVLFGQTRALGFGADAPQEWSGVFHITVWTPAGGGPQAAEERADLLRGDVATGLQGVFYRGQALHSGGVTVIVTQPYDGPVLDTDPNWYGLPVLIPFVCHPG